MAAQPAEHSKEWQQQRFCTTRPGDETGGADGDVASCSARQFASHLEVTLSQLSVLLLDKVNVLQSRLNSGASAAGQRDRILALAAGVQAARYHAQRWACFLQTGPGMPPVPEPEDSAEGAMATMRLVMPRIIELGSKIKAALRQKATPPAVPRPLEGKQLTEEQVEQLQEAEAQAAAEAEAALARKLEARGMPLSDLHALVPHMEQLVFQTNSLTNALSNRRSSSKAEPEVRQSVETEVVVQTNLLANGL